MNLTLDLKSITDTESERSLNDFDSYDSTREIVGEDEKFNERNIVDGDDDDDENEDENDDDDDDDEKEEEGNEENDECEFAMRLRKNLKSYESSLSGNHEVDSLLNFQEFEFDYGRYYGLYGGDLDEYEERCRGVSRTRRNGDLVCFYVNTVTESNDLTKYLRPEYRKLNKCDCRLRNFWSPVGNSLESLSIEKHGSVHGERKNDSDFWKLRSRFAGGCSFRSSFATSKRLDDDTFRRFLLQKLLIPSAPSLISPACRLQCDRSEGLPLDFCACSTTSGRRKRLAASSCDELDGYAASLANAAQSARNLARDLDKLLSNLSTQNGA